MNEANPTQEPCWAPDSVNTARGLENVVPLTSITTICVSGCPFPPMTALGSVALESVNATCLPSGEKAGVEIWTPLPSTPVPDMGALPPALGGKAQTCVAGFCDARLAVVVRATVPSGERAAHPKVSEYAGAVSGVSALPARRL